MDDNKKRAALIVLLIAATVVILTLLIPLFAKADQVTFEWDPSSGHYNKCDEQPPGCTPCPHPEIASYSLWSAQPGTTDFSIEHPVGNVTQATIEIPSNTAVVARATDASGHKSGNSNTVIYLGNDGVSPATNLTLSQICDDPQADYFEEFNYPDNSDPTGWTDTGYNNSMQEQDLYHVINNEFVTKGSGVNYYSHYDRIFDAGDGGFTFTGKFLKGGNTSSDGVGITFISQYQNSDTYYRLRSYANNPFSISSHGYSPSQFIGVPCVVNTWYQFKIQVVDTGTVTQINVKVWLDGQSEPTDWSAEITDTAANRGVSGKIGVWSMGATTNKWGDFKVMRK